MPYTMIAKCPRCNKTAKGFEKIEEVFGWRIINDKKIPQSYCRLCRKIVS